MKKAFIVIAIVVAAFLLLGTQAMAQIYGPESGPLAIFPYVTKDDPNTITIVSIVVPNPAGENADAGQIHYTYIYKDKTASQIAACSDYNFRGKTSPNDYLTFDVSGMVDGGKPLFGDTTSSSLGAPGLNLTVPATEAVLYVEVLDSAGRPAGPIGAPNFANCDTSTASNYVNVCYPDGEALILEIANGGAWGYRAFNNYWTHDEQAILWYDDAVPTMVYPDSIAKTQFIITPLSYGVIGQSGGYDIDTLKTLRAVVQPVTKPTPPGTDKVFDRNEFDYSSTSFKRVKCLGVATLDELVSSGLFNSPVFKAQGAWAHLWNRPYSGSIETVDNFGTDQENEAFVYKVESSSILGKFMINAMPNGGWFFQPLPPLPITTP